MERRDFHKKDKEKCLIESNYCCIICGNIPIEFHHIDKDKSNSTYLNCACLCSHHHDLYDNNLEIKELQEIKQAIINHSYGFPEMEETPFYGFNKELGFAITFENKENKNDKVVFKNNKVKALIAINDKKYFEYFMYNNNLVFSLDIEDEEGKILSKIDKNVLIPIDSSENLIISPQKEILKIYEKKSYMNRIDFEIRKDSVGNGLVFSILNLYFDQNKVTFQDGFIKVGSNLIGTATGHSAEVLIGINTSYPAIIQN